VSWCISPAHLAGQGNADGCRDLTTVESVSLDDDDRTAKACFGANGIGESCPPHLSLPNHHSTRLRMLREVSFTKRSSGASSELKTSSRRCVMVSRSCRERYSK